MPATPASRSAAPHDQAHGLRQLFAGTELRFVPLVHNPQVPGAGAVMERLCAAFADQGLHTLVVDASSQGETIDEVINAWRAARCKGVVLSKIDEAVKLAPALDAVVRHRLKVLAVANGQRVPEDWHRLSAGALVQRAMKGGGSASWRMEPSDVQLVFSTPPRAVAGSSLQF